MRSSAALPRSWEGAIRRSDDPEGQGYPGKASGTLEQHTKAWESRDCWETAQNKAHTRSDQADLRGKGLESTLGLKVQSWTVRQDALNQPLILVGREPGRTSLLSAWPPMLNTGVRAPTAHGWALLGLPPLNTEGSDAWMRVSERAKSLQSCSTLCGPMDSIPPGSSIHEILQTRILEWVAMPSFRGSS